MKLLSLLLLTASGTCLAQSIEQQVIASSGLSGTDGYGLVHTLGEPMVVTLEQQSKVYQGFLQRMEIQNITKKENPKTKSLDKDIVLWPNPVSEKLHLKTTLLEGNFVLMNSLKQVIGEGRLKASTEEIIDLSRYSTGIYFLYIQDNKANTEVFQIVKK